MNRVFGCIACLLFFNTHAQITNNGRGADVDMQARSMFYTSINGQPFLSISAEIEGSPFFKDEWMKAAAVLPDGKLSTYFKGRVNLMNGHIHYLTEKGAEFIATSKLNELFLTDTITGATFHFVRFGIKDDNKPKDVWHQVLVADSVTLYKVITKTLEEYKGYGATATRKSIRTGERYMVQQNTKGAEFKKPKELVSLYPAYKEQLNRFINEHPASKYSSPDGQLIDLVHYLNMLLK